MQRRESYLYFGMDLHKKTHTAVLVNCWNEKLETLVIENKPVEYGIPADIRDHALTFLDEPLLGIFNAFEAQFCDSSREKVTAQAKKK